mmetsp:Transcript_73849/g.204600  ORF Transcript_73849/g.204600 Transcript_73849/m.204600 type:complete len:317 (-) Transcript_73849:177-1127(-)
MRRGVRVGATPTRRGGPGQRSELGVRQGGLELRNDLLLSRQDAGQDDGAGGRVHGDVPSLLHERRRRARSGDEGRVLLEDVHHEEDDVVERLLDDQRLHGHHELRPPGEGRRRLRRLEDGDAELPAREREDLAVHHQQLLRRQVPDLRLRVEHRRREVVHVQARDRRQLGGVHLVCGRRGRRPELQGVREDAREHEPRDVPGHRQVRRLRPRVEDAGGGAERAHVDVEGLRARQAAQLVVIHDGADVGLRHAVGQLGGVVRVDDGDGGAGLDVGEQRRGRHPDLLQDKHGLRVQLAQAEGERLNSALVQLPSVHQR